MKVAVIYNKQEIDEADVIDIFGPPTKEKYNPKTVERVAASLEQGGHNVKIIEGNIDVAEELKRFMPRVIAGDRPGMVFNMAYGIQGQSRYTHIPAMLEMLGVPYVGSGPQAHAIALDKILSKIIFQQHNLPTPKFWFFSSPEEVTDDIEYPVIVKPKMESVSMGLKVVDNIDDLREAVQFVVGTFQQQALVEAFISGQEFAIGMLGNGADLEILPIVEFDFKGNPDAIQSQEEKQHRPIEKVCPANISDELTDEMRRLARSTFNALGIHDFARIDVRMDADGQLYILELNSMASLGLTGSYFKAAGVAGYTYESLVNRMLDVAAVRYFGQDYRPFAAEDEKEEDPSPLRVKVRSYARGNLTTTIDHLRRMVEMNTNVHNTEGVNKLGNWLSGQLGKLGFQKQIFPQTEVGNILYFTNHQNGQNDILLLSHLDTVYGYQDYVPFREERGRLYGSGIAESKGGLAIMLTALSALRFTRRIKRVRCGILLTTDDTLGGRFSKNLVREIAGRSNYVVGLKYGEPDGGVVTSCSGRANFQFELTNIKGPANAHPPDVVRTICQKVINWQKLSSEPDGITIKTTRLEAHTLPGAAPDYASGSLVLHFREPHQGEALEKQIRELAGKSLNSKFQMRVKKNVYRPPVLENNAIRGFYEHLSGISDRLEIKIASTHRETASEVCYVPEGISVLEGLGPLGSDVQSPREYVLRDSLIDRAAMLAMAIRLSADNFK